MDSNTSNTLINSDSSSATSTSNYSRTYATISSAPPKRRAGRTKFRETRHPLFKGVRQRGGGSSSSSSGGPGPAPARWVCELREPNKKSRLWLGTFPTAEMAARAHDVAAMALRGSDACLNFADSAWRLPVPESSDRKEIQMAAAAAAEMFRPTGEGLEVVTTSPAADSDCRGQEKESEMVVKSAAAADSEVGPITGMFDLMMDIEFEGDYYYWDHAIKEAAEAGMMGNSTGSGINNNNNNSIICCSDDWDLENTSIADEVFLWNYSF